MQSFIARNFTFRTSRTFRKNIICSLLLHNLSGILSVCQQSTSLEGTCQNSRNYLRNMQESPGHVINKSEWTEKICKVVPALSFDAHKGQHGRIGIIGGSEEYTGAPYFSAITSLKVGGDLAHVFCTKAASPVIKSYSPELIVHPVLDKPHAFEEMKGWLDRLHAVVIGPGLGRLSSTFDTVKLIIHHLREREIPIVIDADGLALITEAPAVIQGYKKAILTPNIVEFRRLQQALMTQDRASAGNPVADLSNALGGVTVVQKGHRDVIASSDAVTEVMERGSPRRCGGTGDLLSGALGTFSHWAHQAVKRGKVDGPEASMIASVMACMLVKRCAARAFVKFHRSTTATDLIHEIHPVFHDSFELTQP